MSDLVVSMPSALPLPLPSASIAIRPGVLGDVPFMDALQKLHTKQVGWMPTAQFEGKIKLGHVLVAEETLNAERETLNEERSDDSVQRLEFSVQRSPVGYCIGNDQYFKRDDVGIIYQMNVLPGKQRGFVGASLLKAQFERSAYGCKLYCCWCAQDIEANHFWESMGFVPLAYRAGSEKKGPKGPTGSRQPRVHIFWQKRIRSGDVTTPWWFPSKTAGGSIREDRIVLPIPPGTHWTDAKPIVLPSGELPVARCPLPVRDFSSTGNRQLTTGNSLPADLSVAEKKPRAAKKVKSVETPAPMRRNGLMFDIPKQGEPLPEEMAAKEPKAKAPRVKAKTDPRLVAAARELRDRWLEEVNAGRYLPTGDAKYEVGRIAGPVRADSIAIEGPDRAMRVLAA